MALSGIVATRGRMGWALDGLLVGGAAAYLALRYPFLVVGLAVLLAIPVGLAHPGWLVRALIPVSAVSSLVPGGLALAMVGIAILIVVVACRTVTGTGERIRFGRPHLALLGLAILVVVSVRGDGPSTRTSDVAGLLAGLVLLAAVAALPARPRVVARLVVLAGAAAAVHAILAGVEVSGRLSGVGLLANYFGALLAVPAAAGVGLARVERKVLWLVPSAVCVVAIVLTHSRGAAIAAAVGVAIALIAGQPVRRQIVGAILAAIAGVVMVHVANPLSDAVVSGRNLEQLGINNKVRLDAAKLAATEALQHPVSGVGYSEFPQIAADDPHVDLYMNTHNDYLRLAAEAGIATLLLFLTVLGIGLFARAGPAFLPLVAGVAAGAANLLFANTLANLAVSGVFWISLGTLLAGRWPDSPAPR